MSTQGQGPRRGDEFRKPASYGREAWSDPLGETTQAASQQQAGDEGGTRAFSPQELEDARARDVDASEEATTLLDSQAARPAHGEAAARPREAEPLQRPRPQQGAAYQEPLYPERPSAPGRGQARRADQTLVSPIAQERIRAEVNVPDPAYPPQRREPAGRAADAYGRPAPAYSPQPQQPEQPPLRRRRQQRPQQPPVARQGFGYQQPYQQMPYQQQGYQAQFETEEPHHGHGFARGVLLLVSWVLRLAALGLVALVVVNCLTMGNRVAIMRITARVAQLLPQRLAGLYVLDSPLGGVFRGDFAIAAVVLFVIDWIVARIRRRLR